MPRKQKRSKTYKRKTNQKKQSGGTCGTQLDITRYTKPCANGNEMPLDNIFNKHFNQYGGCSGLCPMSGGGYSILPDRMVGGLPERQGYSDCCPPVFTKTGPQFSNNFQPLCGGGSKSRSGKRKHKKHSKRKSKLTKSKKSKSSIRKNMKLKKGGGVKGMSDINSNFSNDMSTRQFGCKQPYWQPGCI